MQPPPRPTRALRPRPRLPQLARVRAPAALAPAATPVRPPRAPVRAQSPRPPQVRRQRPQLRVSRALARTPAQQRRQPRVGPQARAPAPARVQPRHRSRLPHRVPFRRWPRPGPRSRLRQAPRARVHLANPPRAGRRSRGPGAAGPSSASSVSIALSAKAGSDRGSIAGEAAVVCRASAPRARRVSRIASTARQGARVVTYPSGWCNWAAERPAGDRLPRMAARQRLHERGRSTRARGRTRAPTHRLPTTRGTGRWRSVAC